MPDHVRTLSAEPPRRRRNGRHQGRASRPRPQDRPQNLGAPRHGHFWQDDGLAQERTFLNARASAHHCRSNENGLGLHSGARVQNNGTKNAAGGMNMAPLRLPDARRDFSESRRCRVTLRGRQVQARPLQQIALLPQIQREPIRGDVLARYAVRRQSRPQIRQRQGIPVLQLARRRHRRQNRTDPRSFDLRHAVVHPLDRADAAALVEHDALAGAGR